MELRIQKSRVPASGPFSGGLSPEACKGELNRGLASGWWPAGSSQQGGDSPHTPLGSCDVALGNSSRNACSLEGRNEGKRHPEWKPNYRPSHVGRGPGEFIRPESQMLRINNYLQCFRHICQLPQTLQLMSPGQEIAQKIVFT